MVLTYGDVSSYKQDSIWSWFICFCSTACMMLTIGFAFALGVLFPVLMDSFNEGRERVGEFKIPLNIDDKRVSCFVRSR